VLDERGELHAKSLTNCWGRARVRSGEPPEPGGLFRIANQEEGSRLR